MRRLALVFFAVLTAQAQETVLATFGWNSDHGVCSLHGSGFVIPSTLGQRGPTAVNLAGGGCGDQWSVQAMIDSWGVDRIFSTGDMTNVRGTRAEASKGILFRTASAVTGPGTSVSTIVPAITPNGLSQTVQVSAQTDIGWYAISFGAADKEVFYVSARTTTCPGASCTVTAVFRRAHAAGAAITNNRQTINIDQTTGVDCGGYDCEIDPYLWGTDTTFTQGSSLTSIVTDGTAATINFTNAEKDYKVLDRVVVAGSGACGLDGTYPVSAISSNDAIQFASAVAAATCTNGGMTVTTKRIVFDDNLVALDEEAAFDDVEVVPIRALSATSVSLVAAEAHGTGVIIRGSDHTPLQRWLRAKDANNVSKFHPTMGNHDHGDAGTIDWGTGAGNDLTSFGEFWPSVAGGGWTALSAATPYHQQTYNTDLVTLFSLATSGITATGAGAQATAMTTAMTACSTIWCLVAQHYPLFSDTKNTALNPLGTAANTRSSYGWMANDKLDLMLTGHMQAPEHVTFNKVDDATTIHQITLGTSGDSRVEPDPSDDGRCAEQGECTPYTADGNWGTTAAHGNETNSMYQAGKLIFSRISNGVGNAYTERLKVEVYNYDDWTTPWRTFTLEKAGDIQLGPCTAPYKVCFSGGVTIQ